MTSIIGFLECVGASAVLRHATKAELHEALELASLDPQAQSAILANDRPELATITGSRVIANKIITPPGEDDKDDGEEAPEREDEKKEIRAVLADVAASG